MFAILAAAGDIGAAIAPWLTGQTVERALRSELGSRMASWLQVTTEQGAIRLGILVATIFPLIAVAAHLILTRMDRMDRKKMSN